MVQITIDVSEEIERKAKMLNIELSLLIAKMLKDRLNEIEEAEQFKKSIEKSKLTENDVEELSNKINTAMWEHHKI
ncbi:hypothetical protein HYW75_03335 [Candidatus Pacearchaeota archaeon]|nr:hypothetical protein [Candidatus Pacearchaeota archaeon]